MLEDGSLTPRMLLPDVPTHYEGFSPENFDRQYRGAVRADEALAHSLNVPAVRMLKTYGVARFADLLRDAGMTHAHASRRRLRPHADPRRRRRQPLGHLRAVREPRRRSRAPAPATARRRASASRSRSRVESREHAADTPIGTGGAWLTLDTLLEVPRPGEEGSWRSFASVARIAWKTGTSLGLRDGWAVGTTSRYTVGVWVGNASGEGRPGLTGSAMAAPLMFGVVQRHCPRARGSTARRTRCARIDVCENDGYLATAEMRGRTHLGAEVEATSIALSPHNLRVHLDARPPARGRRLRIARTHDPRELVRPAARARSSTIAAHTRNTGRCPRCARIVRRGRDRRAARARRALSGCERARAHPARARRQTRSRGFRGRPPAPGSHDLLASRR